MPTPQDSFRAHIHAVLGYAPEAVIPGFLQRFPTCDRPSDTAGWSRLFDDLRGGVFGCHRRSVYETWSAIRPPSTTCRQRAELARQVSAATAQRDVQQRQQWSQNARRIAQVWTQCVPLIPGDPVTLYLKRRAFGGVWPLPEVLRLHRELPYWHGAEKLGAFPAMVAPIIAPDGRTVALHRTYLTADGRKADLPSPRKLTGGSGPLAGACIRLHKPARGLIGIAEGIETALAAWCASAVPTVAAYCAGNLAAWRWPVSVRRIVIFADADRAGRNAADKLRARAIAARLRCDVMTPTDAGADWCDVWAARGVEVVEGAAA